MGVELLHTALRALANRWLIETCTIRRAATSRTSGGTSATWADLATNVPCSVQPFGGASEAEGQRGGIAATSSWRIRVPYGQDVTASDRIVVGGRTFEVESVEARTFEVRRAVTCTLIT